MYEVCAAVAAFAPDAVQHSRAAHEADSRVGVDVLGESSIVHGILGNREILDQLRDEGDFFIVRGTEDPSRLFLVLKLRSKVIKIEVFRSEVGFVFRDGKTAISVDDNYESFPPRKVRLTNGEIEHAVLRRPIRNSLYHMDHGDVNMTGKIVGCGSYGKVYAGSVVDRPVAVKKLTIGQGRASPEVRSDVLKEAQMMSQLNGHENVVELYGVVDNRKPYYLVMELCTQSLEHFLQAEGQRLSTKERISFALQAARGLEWLHSKGIIHRDLAARNCLLAGNVLKLADFGMSRRQADCQINPDERQNVRWMAPELWTTGMLSFASDIFSFGVLLWELFVIPNRLPYDGMRGWEVKKAVLRGYRLPIPMAMPFTVAQITQECWKQSAAMRPTASKLCQDLERILDTEAYDPLSSHRAFEAFARTSN